MKAQNASSEPIQFLDPTGALDEFAPEPDRAPLRIESPGSLIPPPKVIASGTVAGARRVHPSRFDWAPYARPAVFAGSILMAAIAGILLLQRPATPTPAIKPAERVIASAPRSTMADVPPATHLSVSTAPSEPPSVEAPVPSEVIPPVRGNLRDTPPSRATDTRPIASVLAPAASVALAPRAEGTAAVAAPAPPSIPPAVATLAPDATASTVSTDGPVKEVARPTSRDLDARAIENVLGRYRHAFNTLDAGAAVAVWPTVNARTLARAFEGLDDQDVSFENCTIEVGGVHAEAACNGTARYVPKVGSRTPRAEARRWRFILRRASDGWLIDRIDAR